MSHEQNIQAFIEHYTSVDEACIRFDWNGQHSDGFVDANLEFRQAVLNIVLQDTTVISIELIRDLFQAETKFSREAWGASPKLGRLAEALLRQGGTTYIEDFLVGKYRSFDTYCATAFKPDLELAETMLNAARDRLKELPEDSPEAKRWRGGEELFLSWIDWINARQDND
jgi:hypothetical protein